MIDPNKVTEAVMEFTANPAWQDIFMNAPGGAMERLAISFYFSKFHDEFKPEDFQEYRDLRDEYEKSLTEEDLNYLIENSEKPNAKKHYEELLSNLHEKGGQPEGQMRFEKGEGTEEGQQGDVEQPQESGEEPPPPETEEKVVASETTESADGKDNETVVAQEETTEQPAADEGEKKKDLAEKDEKYDTALSVALEYLQNEQKAIEGETEKSEQSKTN